MNKMHITDTMWLLFIGFILGFVVCAWISVSIREDSTKYKEFKQQAIEYNYAEYVINNKGEIEFQWKHPWNEEETNE